MIDISIHRIVAFRAKQGPGRHWTDLILFCKNEGKIVEQEITLFFENESLAADFAGAVNALNKEPNPATVEA